MERTYYGNMFSLSFFHLVLLPSLVSYRAVRTHVNGVSQGSCIERPSAIMGRNALYLGDEKA